MEEPNSQHSEPIHPSNIDNIVVCAEIEENRYIIKILTFLSVFAYPLLPYFKFTY